jgi:hypothetical protein
MPESHMTRSLSTAELAVLGERVFCEDELTFTWLPVAAVPQGGALTRQNGRNESVLRALSMLEEHDESPAEDAERADFRRIEGKLDLVMELVAELVRERTGSSRAVRMRFSAEGVCWHAGRAEPAGTLLLTEWWLLPAWPVALRLHAEVTESRPEGNEFVVCARLVGVSDTVKDWLEKLVFRRHRRAIAQQRSTRGTDAATSAGSDLSAL